MPNNPMRFKAGFIKVSGGTVKARKRDVITSMRVVNKALVTSSQEAGSPNGTPAPGYAGGGSTGSGGGGGDFGGLNQN